MKDFAYTAATTVDEAVGLLAAQGERAKVLAGGTDIIVQLREGLRDADLVVDVKKIAELMELQFDPSTGLKLGASVPCYRIYEHAAVAKAYPALADSAKIIGGWQIQSRASIGGNLCNSSPAADSTPSLIALDATCEIAGPSGRRQVPVAQFCTGVGKNVLGRGEFLVALRMPPPERAAGSQYLRFIPRNEMDIAVVGVGSWLRLNADGTIAAARIAVGAVAVTAQVAAEASQYLVGRHATEEMFAAAGELAKKVSRPISDKRGPAEYRTHLVGVLTKRTLLAATERAKQAS
ncbi:MAG TPA: xanthine dehydrogenase family protein subunit M [Pirellulales bacterium]|jgi:carbon-monoxide dehydrogenase medium subunit|nr:xanthine dehydrogenase family protein subunit M [Pirellulales bacterium]